MGLRENKAETAGVAALNPEVSVRPLQDSEVEQLVRLWEICDLKRPWNDPRQDVGFCRESATSELLVLTSEEIRPREILGSLMVGHDGHRGWFY